MTLGKKFFWLWILGGLFPATGAFAFNCQVSAGSLNFPTYDIFSTFPTDSTATLHVSCNAPEQNPHAPLPVTIALSSGASGNFAQRQMLSLAGGTDHLNYNLFTNASYSSIWGDGAGSSITLTNILDKNTPWDAVIYARIPARQNVRAGTYSDVITVTVNW